MNSKNLGLFAVVAAIAAVVAFVVVRGERKAETATTDAKLAALFPGLDASLNDVVSVTVRTASGTTTAEMKDDRWTLKDKSGYPIEAGKVRGLLLGLAAMKDLSPRTSRSDQYKSIGVEDVKSADAAKPALPANPDEPPPPTSQSALVTLVGKDGKAIASVIVGNTKFENGGTQGVYVRKPGEPTSYLADLGARRFDLPRQATAWIETKFADITRDRVWSVTITPRDGGDAEVVTVRKNDPVAGAFVIQSIPAGKELKNPGAAESIASTLAFCTFEDVAPASSIDFGGTEGGKPGSAVRVRTWDGLVIDLSQTEQDGKTWWRLTASPDADPYKEAPAAPPPNTPEGAESAPPAAEPKPRRTSEQVAKEVAELNAKWGGWAYAAPAYKSSILNTRLSDQIKDPAPPAAQPSGGAGEPNVPIKPPNP